jgi:shikimate dehydrogenase
MINNKTQLNMVIGGSLQHTQSPILHNSLYKFLHCNAIMLAHSTQNLSKTLQALKTLSVSLIAVTMPFKEAILPYVDQLSAEVEKIKSANTIIRRHNKLVAYNTDIDGIAYALRTIPLANKSVLIIGAGGAAHAAAYYLKKNNATLLWLNRTPKRAHASIKIFGGSMINVKHIDTLPIDIIINTTPLGMFPDIEHSPLPTYQFRPEQTVFDMVYNPIDTLLIKKARSQGALCISGLEMFIGQGLKQIELWLNTSVTNTEMTALVKSTLEKSLSSTEKKT